MYNVTQYAEFTKAFFTFKVLCVFAVLAKVSLPFTPIRKSPPSLIFDSETKETSIMLLSIVAEIRTV